MMNPCKGDRPACPVYFAWFHEVPRLRTGRANGQSGTEDLPLEYDWPLIYCIECYKSLYWIQIKEPIDQRQHIAPWRTCATKLYAEVCDPNKRALGASKDSFRKGLRGDI